MSTFEHRPAKTRVTVKTTESHKKLGIPQKSPANAYPVRSESSSKRSPASHAKQSEGDEQQAEGLYVISVAARLLGMHPQTLRKYERAGLIRPPRTIGMLRLYSEGDITRLRVIKYLVDNMGLNIAGVNLTLSLVDSLIVMSSKLEEMGLDDFKEAIDSQISVLLDLLESQ